MVNFDIAPVSSTIIMVIGVGGGGSNAVNHMFRLGITDVSFMVCNTDRQALDRSPITNKVRLGENLTEGLGAGNKPERGRAAAQESIEEIKEMLRESNTRMVFITAGMGGGTGTGAAPVIAQAAKEMGILTVAIVTIPFKTEGRRRILQAIDGIEDIRHNVDSLLVVNNENIHEIYGELGLSEAFGKADDILATAAKSIAEIITSHHQINVDFADVQTVMRDSGIALMGSAEGSGANRALDVAQLAMSSPLLNHRDISGAQNVLLNITSGTNEVKLSETYEIIKYIQERAGNNNATDLIWGAGIDESLEDRIRITVIATGFDVDSIPAIRERYSEIVKDPKVVPPTLIQEVNQRETISLIDLDADTQNSKKRVQPTTQDDFALVTHGGQPGYNSNSYDQPATNLYNGAYEQPQVTRIESPMTDNTQAWEQSSAPAQTYGYPQSYSDNTQVEQPERGAYNEQPTYEAYNTHGAQQPSTNYYEQQYEPVNVSEFMTTASNPQVQPSVEPQPSAPQIQQPKPSQAENIEPLTSSSSEISYLTEEEIEIPAYIRRRMKIEAEQTHGKIMRETLKSESNDNNSNSAGNLFN